MGLKNILLFTFILLTGFTYSQNREANDCINYVQVCGNQSIQLNPNGIGIQEIGTNACNSYEHNSLWLKFTAETDGTLGFDLIPTKTDLEIDYDFWVFGPNATCGSLGTSIRCSTTNPLASGAANNHTGMRDTEPDNDFYEGPGSHGDNYLKSINVKAGESYFLVIDRPIGFSEFVLNWTGTAKLQNPFENVSFVTPAAINICGTVNYDFKTLDNQILNGNNGFKIGYYNSLDDASYKLNEIVTPININNGNYYYRVYKETSECFITGKITVKQSPLPNIDATKYNSILCDEDLDGKIDINFDEVTKSIVHNSELFKTEFFSDAGHTSVLPKNWSFTADTDVYVKVSGDASCPVVYDTINFKIKQKIKPLAYKEIISVCDNDLNGTETISLSDYKKLFTSDSNTDTSFYSNLSDAKNKTNPIAVNQIIDADATYFVRLENLADCPEVAELAIVLKKPKKSDILKDLVICANAKTTLDAGAGFEGYHWSNGESTQVIKDISVGDYFVDLKFNGCIYRQHVKIMAADLPTISSVSVNGNTATVNTNGGQPPYHYRLDGAINGQESNVFQNVQRGLHTVYVKYKNGCEEVSKEFLILNLLNAITPNGDGYNDKLDYSDLKIYQDVSIQLYDRYGNSVFSSKNQSFVWDGKINGRPAPTSTYWYILQWTEPDTGVKKLYKGWVMVKDR